jgi:hypothetical protein
MPPPAAAPRAARVAQPQKSSSGLVAALVGVAVLGLLAVGGGAWWYLNRNKGTGTTTADSGTGTSGTASPGTGVSTSTGSGASTGTATTASPSPVESAATSSTGTSTTGSAGTGGSGTGNTGTGTPTGTGHSTGGTQTAGNTGPSTGSTGGTTGTTGTGTGRTTGTTTASDTDTSVPTRNADAELSILDQEPPELSGRQTGASVADTYRSNRGSSGGSFGASGRLNARPRAPRDLTQHEKRAAVVLLNLLGLEAVHKRRTGSYGSFQDVMPVAVGSPNRFNRAGYRFDLKLESDGFTIMATSGNGRALQVDDSGYVTYVE